MKHGKKVVFWGAYALLMGFFPIPAASNAAEIYHYTQTIGGKTTPTEWKLEKQDFTQLTWTTVEETVVTWHSPSWATQRCLILRPAEQTHVKAEREGNSLLITGRLKGKIVDKKLRIDSLPWYQALSLSLRPFVLSDRNSLEFWTLRPETLRAYKIRASKSSTGPLTCNGRTMRAQKIKLSLAGILSFIEGSYYWFRIDDGLFLKYEGPASLGTKNKITVEFIDNPLPN